MILVRETRGRTRQDGLHDYYINIPYEEKMKKHTIQTLHIHVSKKLFM